MDDPDAVAAILASRIAVPVVVGDFTAVLELLAPDVLIATRACESVTAPRRSEGWPP